jgi:hypothetical protein
MRPGAGPWVPRSASAECLRRVYELLLSFDWGIYIPMEGMSSLLRGMPDDSEVARTSQGQGPRANGAGDSSRSFRGKWTES